MIPSLPARAGISLDDTNPSAQFRRPLDATASGLSHGKGLLGRLGQALFAPSRHVTSPIERRNARLLAAIDLVASFMLLSGAIEARFLAQAPYANRISLVLLVCFAFAVLSYVASRSRYLRFATALCVGVHWSIPVVMLALRGVMLPAEAADAFAFPAWFTLSILFAGTLSRPWHVLVVGAASALVAILQTAIGVTDNPQETAQVVIFLANVTIVTFVLSRHRDRVEADRSALLLAQNSELRGLKRSLEDRVHARTAALKKSHDELDRAYQKLQAHQRSLILSEKMASLGRLTAGIAHEMGTPVAAVRNALSETAALIDEYARSIDDPDVTDADHSAIAADMRDANELAKKAAERAAAFVRSIKSQTRDEGSSERVLFDAAAAIKDSLQMLAHAASDARCRVHFRCPHERVDLLGTPGKLSQVVTNLVSNAIDATAEAGGGDVHVELRRDGKDIVLTVTDHGPGIPPDIAPRIFDPLFTTKAIGKGTGLGLTIVHDLVHGDLRGRVDVSSEPGRGARFTVTIPDSP